MSRETIGLVGIGLVGGALAGHLIAAGYGVVGYDIDAGRRRFLESLGGTAAANPRAVADRCRRIFLALMTADVVRAVVDGTDGLMRAPTPPTHILDTSTLSPDESESIAARLAERGAVYLDATISGSSRQIADRAAFYMVGGTEAGYADCRDLFAVLTDKIAHVGPSGSGARAKLATNLVLGLNRLALAEGLVFAESLGLDPAAFMDLVRQSGAYSKAVDIKGQKLLDRDYQPQSKVAQHLKDVRLILEHAAAAGQDLPLARLHAEIMDALVRDGHGDRDSCMVVEEIRNRRTEPSR